METADANDTRAKAEGDCARRIQRDFGRFMTCENAILQSLIRKPLDYQRAFTFIPRTMRMMFVHAVQSLWWNHLATRRIQLLQPQQVMVGDLVMVDDANTSLALPPSSSNSNTPPTTPHVVTEDDVQHQRYAITDVVLPLMGSKSVLPQNETGEYCQQLLTEHGLTLAMFAKVADHEVASKGDYRKLLGVPANVVYDIIRYHDPMEPLIQTDLMKLEGVELNLQTQITAITTTPELEPNELETKPTNDLNKVPEEVATSKVEHCVTAVDTVPPPISAQEPLLALVMSFTLSPSAYATIALRELMKRPTSVDYQKDLKMDGPAEDKDEADVCDLAL